MGFKHLLGTGFLVSVLSTSCMKREAMTVRGLPGTPTDDNAANLALPSNPSLSSTDCPGPITLRLIPITQVHRLGTPSEFKVEASGCKNGYSITNNGWSSSRFGNSSSNPLAVFESPSFPVVFSAVGAQTETVRLNAFNSNTLTPQISRWFEVSADVNVLPAEPPATQQPVCRVSPSSISIPDGVERDVRFTVFSSENAKIKSVTSTASPSPIVSLPNFASALAIQSTVEIRLRGKNGSVRFVVENASGRETECSGVDVASLEQFQQVLADFDGDRSQDYASLYKLPGGAYQLQVQIMKMGYSDSIVAFDPGFPASERYEAMLAGDLNGDQKADLIFYRREGSPEIGKFRLALSGAADANGALQFSFISLAGSWPNGLLLEDRRLDVSSNPPRILGKIGAQQYASNLLNLNDPNQASVANPVILVPVLSATPGLSVNSNQAVTINLQAPGFIQCDLRQCTPGTGVACDNERLLASKTDPANPSISQAVGMLAQTTKFFGSCLKAGDVNPSGVDITVQVTAATPSTPAPVTDYTESFDGLDGAFSSPKMEVKVGEFIRTANTISSNLTTPSILTHKEFNEADVRLEANVVVATDSSACLVGRYAGPQDKNMYAGCLNQNKGWIYKNVNGIWQSLGSEPVSSMNGILIFEIVGNRLMLTFDGAHVLSAIDGALTSAGKAGLRSTARAGTTFDDLKISKIVVPVGQATTLPYSDNFDGVPGMFLSRNFVYQLGRGHRTNNKLRSSESMSILTLNGLSARNVRVSADVSIGATNGTAAQLVARYTGPEDRNMYLGALVRESGKNRLQIWRNQGGTWTKLRDQEVSANSGSLVFEVKGTELKLSLNGVTPAVASLVIQDTTLSLGGSVGIRLVGKQPALDNFSADVLP